ncbi:hypothetical protein EWM64_g1279 [Hericium alpestre]|uniref:CST complex subunit Stn1 N-terminal domain-containing protein n=1 Tax=Hericium alpestre TaxID=135208 RepID=A0A4Z0A8W5_9AGAM|nr:hypothetical protein EWM64_g1279 [Hericium alpestre]
MLTPSKRRRDTGPSKTDKHPSSRVITASSASVARQEACKTHTPAEMWKWTLSRDSIAPCFVRDVLSMTESGTRGADYYLLGRIPCRIVKLVGTVVGIASYDRRTIYWLDDGTGVVDCVLPHPEAESRPANKPASGQVKSGKSGNLTKASTSKESVQNKIPPPVAELGGTVAVIGKSVIALHKQHYDSTEPFVIPPESTVLAAEFIPHSSVIPSTPVSVRRAPGFPSPSSIASVSTSPSTSVASSPTKSTAGSTSPPRLRHPSRLHTRDLTANTFRIYVKHYMDNAVHNSSPDDADAHESDTDSDSGSVAYALNHAPATPTKRSRLSVEDTTPRPLNHYPTLDPSHSTPRPSQRHWPTTMNGRGDAGQRTNADGKPQLGFTLSYLRRVPELSELARRVVKAEARRRAREEKLKETQSAKKADSQGSFRASQSEGTAPKMKRLFVWAILKLFKEGSIVLWDGPVRPVPKTFNANSSMLWRASSSTTTSMSFSIHRSLSVDDTEEEELSDPLENEESYIPLTSAYLAIHVEAAIRSMRAAAHSRTASSASRRRRV